jgi:formylglycine-generating enzyme required for sulfatase activity
MGKYEVSNGEFKLFLDNLKQTKNYESYYKYYPDTMLWNKNFAQAFHDPMTNMYNYHPAYRNYPVVNITHEAAVAYCEWLTEHVN